MAGLYPRAARIVIVVEYRAIASPVDQHRPHPVHAQDRFWPETNCYIDLWIELSAAWGRDPRPLLGLAAGLDWQADHFTFLKPAPHELFGAVGVVLHELALWDDVERQVTAQIANGAIPILEVDAFFLPDTPQSVYRENHTKTTIAISAISPTQRWLEYFHNAGRFRLADGDYDGVFGRGPSSRALFPYAEVARLTDLIPKPLAARRMSRSWLTERASSRAPGNPVDRFASALPGLLQVVGTNPQKISALCFNSTRQLGGTAELLADYFDCLGQDGSDARQLASRAKTIQFLISRSARRSRIDPGLAPMLDEMASIWASLLPTIEQVAHSSADQLEIA